MTFDTDKVKSGYADVYAELAQELPPDSAVCEIGVQRGGSLDLWRSLFPASKRIVGVDIDPCARWPEDTIKICADQTDSGLLALVDPAFRGFDLIVDDASHIGDNTMRTFETLWRAVHHDGFYVIEDWTADLVFGWRHYPGQFQSCTTDLLRKFTETPDIAWITYLPGMVLIRKRAA